MTSSARAPGAIVRKAKSFVIAQRVPMSSPATFAVLDLLVLLDQAKSTRKESVRKNFPINFSGIIPSQCLGDFLRGADLPPFDTKRWRQKCPQGEKLRETHSASLKRAPVAGLQANRPRFLTLVVARFFSALSAMRSLLCASRNDDLFRCKSSLHI